MDSIQSFKLYMLHSSCSSYFMHVTNWFNGAADIAGQRYAEGVRCSIIGDTDGEVEWKIGWNLKDRGDYPDIKCLWRIGA